MRIYIEDRQSGRRLDCAGNWTVHTGFARRFSTMEIVLNYCAEHSLQDAQIVVAQEDGSEVCLNGARDYEFEFWGSR